MSFRAIACVAVVVFVATPARRDAPTQPAAQPDRLTSYVNPFIGTGGHGHTFPGPSLPFGMIQPGPDTRLTGWDSCSGYHYSDSRIVGFSHTHLSGTGIPDYGDILLMPTTGEARLSNGLDGTPGYSSSFSHATEEAEPGYYAVTLQRLRHPCGVDVDAARRTASVPISGRTASPRGARPRASRRGDRLVDQRRLQPGGDGPSPIARLGEGPAAVLRDSILASVSPSGRLAHTSMKALFDFGDNGGPLLVKVGISAVSIDGARRNLERRAAGVGLRRRAPVGQRRVGA